MIHGLVLNAGPLFDTVLASFQSDKLRSMPQTWKQYGLFLDEDLYRHIVSQYAE